MEHEHLVPTRSRDKLEMFVGLLDRWRKVTNLISEESFQSVWERHILDSICLQRLFPARQHWLDFGSGAGFPGIVLGILLAEEHSAQIHCVESDSRKAAFLRTAVQSLQIPVKIHNTRAEAVFLEDTGPVEIVTARAFSSVGNIMSISEKFMRAGAVLVLPRGKTSKREVESIDLNHYTTDVHANPLGGGGIFLQIRLRTESQQ